MFLWSRKFFPKVFGGVFGLLVFPGAYADNREVALNAAKNATLVSSGIKQKLDETQRYYQGVLITQLKNAHIEKEVFALGAIVKTARDKRIDFIYRGNAYSITPNSVFVRIPF